MRRSGWVLTGVGALLIVCAVLLRFVVAPSATKLPADTDITTAYSGKGTVLNAAALQSGDVANALARDIPVTLDRHVYVSDANSDTAIVHDDLTLKAGTTSSKDNHTYAVDRMEITGTASINGVEVEKHQGLTVSLPVDPEPKSGVYTYWDTPTRTAVPVTYVGTETRAGRDTYHYRATASGAVANPALLQQLPSSLPRTLALETARSAARRDSAEVAPARVGAAGPVPLSYTATSTYDVWADAALGAPLDTKINRSVVANVGAGAASIPLLPVLTIDVAEDQASVQDAADRVANSDQLLSWIEVWGPSCCWSSAWFWWRSTVAGQAQARTARR